MMKKYCVISGFNDEWKSFESTAACDRIFCETVQMFYNAGKEKGVKLYTAMNKGLETLLAESFLLLKNSIYAELECVVPYEEQAAEWTEEERNRYYNILENCDKEKLISKKENKNSLRESYEYMIESCDVIIVGENLNSEITELITASGKQIVKI